MSLTPKQERFAQLVAEGKTQADAYRGAFNTKPTTKPETIIANASRLMADSRHLTPEYIAHYVSLLVYFERNPVKKITVSDDIAYNPPRKKVSDFHNRLTQSSHL